MVLLPKSLTKRHEQSGTIEYQPLDGGLKSLIKDKHKKFIIQTIDEDNTITLFELRKKIEGHFKDIKSIGISTLSRFLKYERITLKRAMPIEGKRGDVTTL
ncbi:hypothetical protein EDC94DRAFT_660143 [Helicostylum pulchrum]|nr:hypothetical protein EDC94DRAFT_660143 [Helicostylum pulchrum]